MKLYVYLNGCGCKNECMSSKKSEGEWELEKLGECVMCGVFIWCEKGLV